MGRGRRYCIDLHLNHCGRLTEIKLRNQIQCPLVSKAANLSDAVSDSCGLVSGACDHKQRGVR